MMFSPTQSVPTGTPIARSRSDAGWLVAGGPCSRRIRVHPLLQSPVARVISRLVVGPRQRRDTDHLAPAELASLTLEAGIEFLGLSPGRAV
jgi:hypothetical protein